MGGRWCRKRPRDILVSAVSRSQAGLGRLCRSAGRGGIGIFAVGFLSAPQGVAKPVPVVLPYPDAEERAIEAKLWSSDDKELAHLEREIVRLIQKQPSSVFAHHLMAHLKIRLFAADPQDLYTLKQASDLAQQALDLDIKNPVGYVAMADVLDLMGAGERGLELLTKAEAAGIPPNWRFYFTKARLMAADVDGEKVLSLLDKALSMRDAEVRIVVPYVVAILQADFTGEELVEKLRTWGHRFPSPLFDLSIAGALAEKGDARAAHVVYQEIIKRDGHNREAIVNDAILLYRDLQQEKQAIKVLSKVLSDTTNPLENTMRSAILVHLGAAHIKAREWASAQESFVKAISLSPKNITSLDLVAKSYRDAKAHDKLVGFLRAASEVSPGISVMHALIGETLSENLNQHDDALMAFTDAITLDPERGDYYNGMGLAYYRAKNFPQALRLFATAMRIDPNDAVARYNEACVLAIMGRNDEALESLADALSLDPRLLQTARKDSDFENIRGIQRFRELTADTPGLITTFDLSH